MPEFKQPILYSFRRCPYAIRARLALFYARINVEIREIVLREKPKEFLATSPSGTVPSLRLKMTVLDESLDIMKWALGQNDPTNLMEMPEYGFDLISECDGNFKRALDRTKYPNRFPDAEAHSPRGSGDPGQLRSGQTLPGTFPCPRRPAG